MIVSHAGRRQWDEACWYPDAAKDATFKKSMSNETLGLHLIHGRIYPKAFDLVAALAHNLQDFTINPEILGNLDFLISIYADHRTTQKYEPLHTRMGDFLMGNFLNRDEITPTTRDKIYHEIENLITKQKNYRLGKIGGEEISLEAADEIAANLGAAPMPSWETVLRYRYMETASKSISSRSAEIGAFLDEDFPSSTWWGQYARKVQ